MSGLLTPISAGDQFQFQAPERWVVERKFRCVAEPSSTVPYTVLLLDRQYYLAQGASFVRHIRQVHHNTATADLSKINIPFAPHRESLTIHWIRIWRAGESIPQLRSAKGISIKEPGQADSKVAHFKLPELRKGDSLDVAYSLKSHTPTRQFSAIHPIRQRVPILDWSLSAIVPPDSELSSRSGEASLRPIVSSLSEGSQFYQWKHSDLAASQRVENAPVWFRPSPELQITNTDCWPKIAAKIHQNWQIQALGKTTATLAKQFSESAGGDLWEAARGACRFVQNEIAGLPAHALVQSPVTPADGVVESGAGDAKSKACLLVQLLRALGIPAAAVLVSRTRLKTIASMLPAADLFDHVIVRGRWDEQDFWIDPCATHESGPIQLNTLPNYGIGLQVSTRTKNLSSVPLPDSKSNLTTITEHFTVLQDGSATLKSTTRAIGNDANRLRRQLATTTEEAFFAHRLAERQRPYPSASFRVAASIRDDAATNEITLEEHFDLPKITMGGRSVAHFTPVEIRRNLPGTIARRDTPLALPFPCNLRYLTVIDTPWPVETNENSGNSPGTAFAISYKHSTAGNRHTLRYAFSTLDDHIVPVDLDAIQMRVDSLRPHLDYHFAPLVSPTKAKEKSGKGARIIKEIPKDSPVRQRKSGPNTGGNFILPIVACIAAVILVIGVRASFKDRAIETSETIKENRIAQKQIERIAEKPEPPVSKYSIPDDPRLLLEPLPPLPSSSALDGVKFGVGDGEAPPEKKASEQNNVTSGDYKLR